MTSASAHSTIICESSGLHNWEGYKNNFDFLVEGYLYVKIRRQIKRKGSV